MKQHFAIFDFNGKSYPITNCVWNNRGRLMLVVASTPYERGVSNMDFPFTVVESNEHEIRLVGLENEKFTAKIKILV